MITYRPVEEADLPTLEAWMNAPHWQEWWGIPATELGYIKKMLDGADTTRPYIFRENGIDKGYIQVWQIGDQLTSYWIEKAPWLTMVPQDAVGVDLSIGAAADLGRGLGTAALKGFVSMLLEEGHDIILIDPDLKNFRAVAAYRKAGFLEIPDLLGRTGDSLIMQYDHKKGA